VTHPAAAETGSKDDDGTTSARTGPNARERRHMEGLSSTVKGVDPARNGANQRPEEIRAATEIPPKTDAAAPAAAGDRSDDDKPLSQHRHSNKANSTSKHVAEKQASAVSRSSAARTSNRVAQDGNHKHPREGGTAAGDSDHSIPFVGRNGRKQGKAPGTSASSLDSQPVARAKKQKISNSMSNTEMDGAVPGPGTAPGQSRHSVAPSGLPIYSSTGIRPGAVGGHLNDLAVGNSPTDGLNQRACGSDAMMSEAVKAAGLDSQPGTQLMVTVTVCRAIWRTSLIGAESALYDSSESKHPEMNSKSDTPTLATVFPPSVLQLLTNESASAFAAPGDMQLLENVLAPTSKQKLIELRIFRERALAFLAMVAAAAGRDSDLSLYQTKANIMHTTLEEEFGRRKPGHCAGCWRLVPVFVCGCGEGYCLACGTCYGSGALQASTEITHIICNVCRLEAGIQGDRQDECSDAIATQTDMVRAGPGPVSRCLSCGRVATTRSCSSCSTPFCFQCAVNWPPEPTVRQPAQLYCRSCTDEVAYIAECSRREKFLVRWAIPSQALCRTRGETQMKKCPRSDADKARPFAIQLTELCMSSRLCGLYGVADQMLAKVFNAAMVQLGAGAASSFTPRQIIYSMGHSSCVSTELLRMVLEARAAQTMAESCKADATWARLGSGPRVSGPIRVGYWITAAAWSLSMFECVVPWLTQWNSELFLVTLILLGGEDAHLQALEEMLYGGDESKVTEGQAVAAAPARARAVLKIGDKLSDEEAYKLVCQSNLDIAVDLDCGGGARPALIHTKGIARKIVHAVGMACPQPKKNKICDFILGDDKALPQEMKRAWSGGVAPVLKVRVGRPFWISRALTAMQSNSSTRADYQLPPAGFIFVHIEEVSPASPDAMQQMLNIVHRTPGSCLVMMGQTMWSKASLRGTARAFACSLPPTAQARFDPEVRILFRPWPERTDDRIKLMSHGDLLLVSREGGSVTAAGLLALAACLPALVCVSDSHVSGVFGVLRDISSALWYMGLGQDLVVDCERTFIEKAQELGNHRAKILFMKEYLRAHIADGTALFSEKRQVLEWEHGLKKVHQIASGKSIPDSKDCADGDIDATLDEFEPCMQLQYPWQDPKLGPQSRGVQFAVHRSNARAEPKDRALKTAMQRESIVRQMAEAHKEFDGAEAKAQLDSLLEDAQERGVELRKSAGGGGFSSVVLGNLEDASTVAPGVTGVALIFERRKAAAARVYNRALFRYHLVISSSRRRQPHDDVMVRPVWLFEKGTSCFSISFPDEKGESIFCLVVEELAQGYLEGLQSDIEHWTTNLRLTEGLRCDFQETLHALNRLHQSSIVHGDIKHRNIMRNEKNGIVFIDLGSGWRFDGRDNKVKLLQRRATSAALNIDLSKEKLENKKRSLDAFQRMTAAQKPAKKAKVAAPSAKEQAVSKHLPRSGRNQRGCGSTAMAAARKGGNGGATSASLPNGRKPMHLSDKAIRSIMQSMAERGSWLATVGPTTSLFRRPAVELGKALTNEEGIKSDAYALFRTFMILLRPVKDSESTHEWDRAACEAVKSVKAMQRFLQSGRMGSGRAVARLADFIWQGIRFLDPKKSQTHEFVTLPIYPEEIERLIFYESGFLVKGGKMSTVPGCPVEICTSEATLKDVLVIMEPGIDGVGLQAVQPYVVGEMVSYYLGRRIIGAAIYNCPPGRYVVAVKPRAEYCNGEFTKERTLEWYAQHKAMGVCINAPTRPKTRNCLLLRSKAQIDKEDNFWIPVVAARDIAKGEFFSFTYDHEAAGGNGYSFA